MSFLNVAMLGGLAACLAPLLIHLLNRSRFRSVDWGAMHLLETAMQVNSRRYHWESLLLLLVRCSIPAVLAVCLARPVLTYSRVIGAQGKKSLVLVVDDSLSMTSPAANDESLFQATQRELLTLARRFRSAEISVWTAGVRPTCLTDGSTFDEFRVAESLRQIRPGAGRIDPVEAINSAIRQLVDMNNPSRHIVVASDFCAVDWNAISEDELEAIRRQLASLNLPVHISLFNMNARRKNSRVPNENVAVTLADNFDDNLLPGEVGRFAVRVRNYGQRNVELTVMFSVDGSDVSQRSVSVGPDTARQALFACEFPEPGWHTIECRVVGPAGPSFDDRLGRVMRVAEPIQALLVTDSHTEEFEPSVDYLRLALAPFAAEQRRLNRFQIQIAQAPSVEQSQLDKMQVVVLSGIKRLTETTANLLVDFVQAGGGLLVFPGDKLDLSWINDRFYDQDKLLPMRYGQRQQVSMNERLLREPIQYPRLQILNRRELSGDWGEWEFSTWHSLIEPHDRALRILTLSNGDAFLATHPFGKGTVHQCAVSGDEAWSNMPLKSAYVPFIQQLVLSLAADTHPANIRCGETAFVSVNYPQQTGQAAAPGTDAAHTRWIAMRVNDLQQSDSLALPLRYDPSSKAALLTETRYPGLFRVSTWEDPDSAAPPPPPVSIEPPLVSLERPADESNLQLLSDIELQQLAERLGATVVESAGEFQEADRLRQNGREVWSWLLAGLLVLLVAEVFITRAMSRGTVG